MRPDLTPADLESEGLILFEAVSGSRAYGLATPESDWDLRGVFMAPLDQLFGLQAYQPQVQDEKHNTVYYELGRFFDLLGRNNPTVLELLASPQDCIRLRHPLIDKLDQSLFLSRLCRDTFGQYALAQVKKARGLNKKIVNPLPIERKGVLECCFVTVGGQSRPLLAWLQEQGIEQQYCGLVRIDRMPHLYALYHDAAGQAAARSLLGYAGIVRSEQANDVCLSSVARGEPVVAYLSFNLDYYKKQCREYKAYWDWVGERNQARFEATLAHGKQYDAKNMMHTFRLLAMAEEIATTGRIIVRRPDREFLFGIRSGESDYDHLVREAELRIQKIDALFAASALPEKPDTDAMHALLMELRIGWFGSLRPSSG